MEQHPKFIPLAVTTEDEQKLAPLVPNLGLTFNHLGFLKEALIHRSYLNENRDSALRHNERLEFLGDAVLELIVTEHLFKTYQDRPEGELTSFRAALVRTESLAAESEKLNLGEYLYMSKGEEGTGGRKRQYILANTFEAVLGAIYLDQGLESCVGFLNRVLIPKMTQIVEKRLDIDAKSRLQEIAQEQLKITPVYVLLSDSGPDHDKTFTMGVTLGGMQFGSGSGRSKQEAEQVAASSALENWAIMYEKYSKSARIRPAN